MKGLSLRKARPEDAATLADFWRACYGETFGHLYPPEDLAAFYAAAYNPATIAAEIANPSYVHWLAEAGDALVGAMKGGAVSLPLAETIGLWELHRLYLTPTAQGTGLGDAFMRLAREEARAQGAEALVLGVFSENERALRFYARQGFEKIGAYHFVVGQTLDDEWIMRAPLRP